MGSARHPSVNPAVTVMSVARQWEKRVGNAWCRGLTEVQLSYLKEVDMSLLNTTNVTLM
jgi:hypothetical protein